MTATIYDIVVIGGGLGGSSLAKVMADNGASVLVVESEEKFRDRVRGEAIMPWGVAEAKELGLYDAIMQCGSHELPWWDMYIGPNRVGHRDLPRTTAPKESVVAFYHPTVQEALIQIAISSGAEVKRGSRVRAINLVDPIALVIDEGDRDVEVRARLVVGADGRASLARRWGRFQTRYDVDQNLIAGVLFDGAHAPEDACHYGLNSSLGMTGLIFPQGEGRVRAYICCRAELGHRYSGKADIPGFLEDLSKTGVPPEYYLTVSPAGPLATFDGASAWVEHPYRDGVVLLGDAAASSDPTWGQGLSLTLRDVRVLRDQLLRFADWSEAGNCYAEQHDLYYNTLHTFELWETKILMEIGPEADARREKVIPLWSEDRSRIPDIFLSGPDQTLDEAARRRFFGDE